jgi:FkbM family methyltransferase
MLIPFEELNLSKPVTGVIHVGAHECEEKDIYINYFGLTEKEIIWVDALEEKVKEMKEKNPLIQIYHSCIADVDNRLVSFMITSNYQSSSILNFKSHVNEHPYIYEIDRIHLLTKKLDTLLKENNIIGDFNFLNLDIQGAELLALKGAEETLKNIDYIYTEINLKELYEGCCLLGDLDNFLEEKGFTRVKTVITSHGWGDAFYQKIVKK